MSDEIFLLTCSPANLASLLLTRRFENDYLQCTAFLLSCAACMAEENERPQNTLARMRKYSYPKGTDAPAYVSKQVNASPISPLEHSTTTLNSLECSPESSLSSMTSGGSRLLSTSTDKLLAGADTIQEYPRARANRGFASFIQRSTQFKQRAIRSTNFPIANNLQEQQPYFHLNDGKENNIIVAATPEAKHKSHNNMGRMSLKSQLDDEATPLAERGMDNTNTPFPSIPNDSFLNCTFTSIVDDRGVTAFHSELFPGSNIVDKSLARTPGLELDHSLSDSSAESPDGSKLYHSLSDSISAESPEGLKLVHSGSNISVKSPESLEIDDSRSDINTESPESTQRQAHWFHKETTPCPNIVNQSVAPTPGLTLDHSLSDSSAGSPETSGSTLFASVLSSSTLDDAEDFAVHNDSLESIENDFLIRNDSGGAASRIGLHLHST
jgi:hypothetical protein